MNPVRELTDLARSILYFWLAIAYVGFIARGALPSDKAPGRRKPSMVLIDRVIFFLAFFLIPSLGFTFLGFRLPGWSTLSFRLAGRWVLPVGAASLAAFGLGLFSRKGEAERASYPQYLPLKWTGKTVCIEIISWSMYLFAYEFAFRGMILQGLLPSGYWTAIAVQTGLYAFAHLPKSGKEAAAAILFGAVTSLMTLGWGTVIPAFLVHLALALGNDLGSERARKAALTEPLRGDIPRPLS